MYYMYPIRNFAANEQIPLPLVPSVLIMRRYDFTQIIKNKLGEKTEYKKLLAVGYFRLCSPLCTKAPN